VVTVYEFLIAETYRVIGESFRVYTRVSNFNGFGLSALCFCFQYVGRMCGEIFGPDSTIGAGVGVGKGNPNSHGLWMKRSILF
jgi:hypothetical protein